MKTKHTILVVDDTRSNLDILVDLLAPHEVSVALDGPTALEMAASHAFDLILLDIMMPGMDGYEVCRKLKSDEFTRGIPIIFITAKTDEASIETAFEAGGIDYVTKPFKPGELLARVSTHLKLRSMMTRLADLVETEVMKRREQELLLQRQAKMAAVGEMLDAVAHQWKQPLNVIMLQTAFLLMEDEPLTREFLQERHDRIVAQVDHMVKTLDQFRSFLRPGSVREWFKVTELFGRIGQLMKDTLGSSMVSLEVDGIDPKIRAYGNESELVHVFINIINNAIDVFEERGIKKPLITVSAKEVGNGVLLQVEDNAGGIPEVLLPHIFKPDVSGKPEGKGTGIGLYMSRQIVEKHGGQITACNTEAGACFDILLPGEPA